MHLAHATEYMLMGISVGLALIAIIYAWTRFSKKPEIEEAKVQEKYLQTNGMLMNCMMQLLQNHYLALGAFFKNVIEKSGIDVL